MTCIVGLVDYGTVHIAGDSAGVAGYHRTIRADSKVFANGPMAFGFTSSYRMGQLLRHKLHVPKQHDESLMDYMCGTFIDAVRSVMKEGGYMRTSEGAEQGGCFMVGYAGHLFIVESDFQVGEPADEFAAIGCGDEFAIGAMAALRGEPPRSRLSAALSIAERYSTGVQGPFEFVSTAQANG